MNTFSLFFSVIDHNCGRRGGDMYSTYKDVEKNVKLWVHLFSFPIISEKWIAYVCANLYLMHQSQS